MFVKQDKKKIAQFGNPTQLNVRPHQVAPIQSKQSAGEMLTQMALSKGLDKGLDKGIAFAGEKLGALTQGAQAATAGAGTTAGVTGAMGALGTAMPYVGAGLGLAKMLGLFSKGGKVGPLAKATYAANGEKITAEFDKVPDEVLDAIKKERYLNELYGRKNLSDGYTLRHNTNKMYEENPDNPFVKSLDMNYGLEANRLIDEGLERERLINFLRSQIK